MIPRAIAAERAANEAALDRYRWEGWTVIDGPAARSPFPGRICTCAIIARGGEEKVVTMLGDQPVGLFERSLTRL